MNHCIPITISLLFFTPLLAQPKPTNSCLSDLSTATIRLNSQDEPSSGNASSIFRHFEVLDLRPDTTRIGIHYAPIRLGKPHNVQLVFPAPTAQTLSNFLDRHFARPDAPYTLLIILRNLWLSDAKYLREDMIKDPDKAFERSHLRVRMEVYATRDSLYLPVYRLDTLVIRRLVSSYDLTSSRGNWDRNLVAVLNEIADTAALLVRCKNSQSRLVSLEQIERFNKTRFTNPVDDQPLKTGVYANFEEFRNNAPSMQDYEIKMDKNQLVLYIQEGGKTYYSHNAWGYCDGKNIYIMRNGSLCRSWREGKAWYLYGEADFQIPTDYSGTSLPYKKPGVAGTPSATIPSNAINTPFSSTDLVGANRTEIKRTRIYRIDLDSGDIY